MKRPLVGDPVRFADFFKATPRDHILGLLGGAIWGTGAVFNFVAASFTGVAISYALGQSAPMVAALWGLFVWKEFAGANAKAHRFLGFMFLFYVLAITLVATSST
jgi:glucose uptake protein